MAKNYRNILIDGLPRTGKKRLGRLLSEKLEYTFISDIQSFAEHSLSQFYKDIERYALLTELSFLIQRYKQLNTMVISDIYSPNRSIFTFSMEKSKIYATFTLSNHELVVFEKIYEMLSKPIPIKHDLIIFLYSTPDKLLKKIKKKPLNGEEKMSLEYLEGLFQVYNHHYSRLTGIPIVFFENEYPERDFEDDIVEQLIEYIDDLRPGINLFKPLHP